MIGKLRKFKRTAAAYRALFLDPATGALTPQGKAVLMDMAAYTRMFKPAPPDAVALALAEGGRQVLAHVLKTLKVTDDALGMMLDEQMKGESDE